MPMKGAYPGSFTGQQVFSAGSYANNVAYGRKKREAQFNQNYLPGSFSTNINNNPVFPVPGYLGLQNPGYGNSLSANRELGAGYGASLGAGLGASFGAGYGSNFVQNYGFGSSATNIGRKWKSGLVRTNNFKLQMFQWLSRGATVVIFYLKNGGRSCKIKSLKKYRRWMASSQYRNSMLPLLIV